MPIDGGRDLAAAHRVEEAARSCRSRTQITTMLTSVSTTSAQHEERLVALAEVDRAEQRAGAPIEDLRAAADPVELHHHLVEEERERERREREEDAAEPQRREREQRADGRGDDARR